MSISKEELKGIATLAALSLSSAHAEQLTQDVSAILTFANQLLDVDTASVAPLPHPLDLHLRLRLDEVTEPSHLTQLASVAPEFADDLYLVPKVIDAGK